MKYMTQLEKRVEALENILKKDSSRRFGRSIIKESANNIQIVRNTPHTYEVIASIDEESITPEKVCSIIVNDLKEIKTPKIATKKIAGNYDSFIGDEEDALDKVDPEDYSSGEYIECDMDEDSPWYLLHRSNLPIDYEDDPTIITSANMAYTFKTSYEDSGSAEYWGFYVRTGNSGRYVEDVDRCWVVLYDAYPKDSPEEKDAYLNDVIADVCRLLRSKYPYWD